MMKASKFENKVWYFLDCFSYLISYPCFTAVNYCFASFIPTTDDSFSVKCINSIVIGPVGCILALLFLPLGLAGTFLWLFTCICAKSADYRYWEFPSNEVKKLENKFSVATANVCLLPEFLSRFNNNKFSLKRCLQIAKKLLNENPIDGTKEEHLTTEFPDLDFICLQEVWERITAWLLIYVLKKKFHYFVYDVGKQKWNVNHFFLGSGLMFASKYPILDVNFNPFTAKTFQGGFTSIGLLQVKVLIEKYPVPKVGYIATTHLQSYQGKSCCLLKELDECLTWLQNFHESTKTCDELILFDIFCGDFNFDNLSPGDKMCSNHPLFNLYIDPCKVDGKGDHDWAIGTEFRQRMLWNRSINSAENLKRMLLNPIERRRFLLDADVLEQTIELAFKLPPYEKNGEIQFSETGGRRRIDYILYNKGYSLNIIKFYYVTALTQTTDHIPLNMIFTINES